MNKPWQGSDWRAYLQPWTLKNVWKVYSPGESEPLFTLKSSSAFSFKPKLNIFLSTNTAQKTPDYTVDGGFLAKKCRIFFGDELVAEVPHTKHKPFLLTNPQSIEASIALFQNQA